MLTLPPDWHVWEEALRMRDPKIAEEARRRALTLSEAIPMSLDQLAVLEHAFILFACHLCGINRQSIRLLQGWPEKGYIEVEPP
jgi:hypothetical protein